MDHIQTGQGEPSEAEETLRHMVAGMLSTIEYTPSQLHPAQMLPMADKVIHHIRTIDTENQMSSQVSEELFDRRGIIETSS